MAGICRNCDVSNKEDLFQCILSGSSDGTYNQCITFGCLYKLLRWARDNHQLLKSGISNPYVAENSANTACVPAPNISNISNITDLVHGIIRHIDTYGASASSSTSQKQLKTQLPAYWSLNRSVTRALSASNFKCCLPADCIYVSCDDTPKVCKTPAQRKRDSRQRHADQHEYEQSYDRARKRARRVDSTLRQQEQSANTQRRRARRHDSTLRQQEQTANTQRRRARRRNEDIRREEQLRNTCRKRNVCHCADVSELITRFHNVVSTGPVFVCSSCDQLLYKHSIQKTTTLRCSDLPIITTVLLNKTSFDGVEYICQTCCRYLRKNQMPPCAIANCLQFPEKPPSLPVLNMAEWRMLSPRLAFMRIHEAAVGRQLRIHGNVVCVPADVCTAVNMLPRTTSELETVAIQLKRRSQYQHAMLTSNVRPVCIREVGQYLAQSPLFKQENISFSHSILQSLETDENITVSDSLNTELSADQARDTAVQRETDRSVPASSAEGILAEVDTWNEVHDVQSERAGVYDTMFTSPDFVEDAERSAVYGHINAGLCDKVYSFAPAEGNRPVSVFLDKYSEELAFPNIFWGMSRSESHQVKISYADIVKSELRRSDRRVATCIDNLFFKLKKVQMQAITSKVQVAVRKHKTGGHVYTAGQLKGTDSISKLVKFDDGYRVLKDVRGSPPYWEKAKRDLYAMIRQLGPAQLFITLSAAETRWVHLLQILSEVVDNRSLTDEQVEQLSWSDKCRLISSDPITCARHFDFSVQHFFSDFLKQPLSPFGQLKDYWYRIEFQHRGSPHMHCLLWIADVPQYSVDDTKSVTQYIDQIISCRRTWDDEELDNLVDLQLHKHTRTCKKQFRKTTVCRFGFPKYPMMNTEILQPLVCQDDQEHKTHAQNFTRVKAFLAAVKPSDEQLTMTEFLSAIQLDYDSYILAIRSSLKTATILLKRAPNELRVNNYNVQCLRAWRANHDIQFILDVYACASYITAYIAKGSRGMSDLLRKTCEEARHGNSTLKQQVRMIGNKFLNNVEVSAQETVYLLLQLPLKRSSRQVVFVNTSPPEERVYLLKSNIDQLPDDAEVAESNVIARYSRRRKSLETVCLAEYVAFYDNTSHPETDSNSDDEFAAETETLLYKPGLKRRKIARVIRTFLFDPESEPEKSARQKLMLYFPWRNEHVDLYGEFETYTEHYDAIKTQLACKVSDFEPYANEVEMAQQFAETENIQEQWDLLVPGVEHAERTAAETGTTESEAHATINPAAHGQHGAYDLGIDLGLAHPIADSAPLRYSMPNSDYYALMQSLNDEQITFVYDTVHQLKTSEQPVYRFLSGGAGTGKSYVLQALREITERFYKSRSGVDYQQQWTMTLAPTGKAAFIAGGATVHSVLRVPANQSLTYNRLDYESLNTLRTQISHIKLWLIDEISMIGFRMLSFINQRLQEVNNTNRPFGGASVIAFGDFFQLPPVMDAFVFDDLNRASSHDEDYSALAPNLWKELFTMFELTRIMRQQDSKQFAELLNRLREGHHSDDDLQVLRTRIITQDSADYPSSAQHLFKTNRQVEMFNTAIYDKCSQQKYTVRSVDSVVGAVSNDMATHILNMLPTDTRKTMQLPSVLPLAVSCRYEMSVNVNVSDGLANGAGGVLRRLQLTSNNHTASGIAWIQFDDSHVGSQARADNQSLYRPGIDPQWTPIQPLSRQFQVGRSQSNQVLRKQFPLRQSAAKTIHRSQGDTLDEVVVDMTSSRREPHVHYVALSRVRSLQGLFVLNLSEDKIHISDNVRQEMAALRTYRKLLISLYFPPVQQASTSPLHITFLNVRSLHSHIDLVRHDRILCTSQINMFCESRVKQADAPNMYDICNYSAIHYPSFSNSNQRSPYGISVYTQLPVVNSSQLITMNESSGSAECVVLQTALTPDLILSVYCVYCSPRADENHFKRAMSQVASHHQTYQSTRTDVEHITVILGDFNMDWFQSSTQSLMSSLLPGFRQLVTDCTTDYQSLLDQAYTDIPVHCVQCYTGESYFTDHKPITLAIDVSQYHNS